MNLMIPHIERLLCTSGLAVKIIEQGLSFRLYPKTADEYNTCRYLAHSRVLAIDENGSFVALKFSRELAIVALTTMSLFDDDRGVWVEAICQLRRSGHME